eukprot:5055152-Amphidinium_carterae.2
MQEHDVVVDVSTYTLTHPTLGTVHLLDTMIPRGRISKLLSSMCCAPGYSSTPRIIDPSWLLLSVTVSGLRGRNSGWVCAYLIAVYTVTLEHEKTPHIPCVRHCAILTAVSPQWVVDAWPSYQKCVAVIWHARSEVTHTADDAKRLATLTPLVLSICTTPSRLLLNFQTLLISLLLYPHI